MSWSKVPAKLRQGLKAADAVTLRISEEYHHAGKFANKVFVYYIEQVEAYWEAFDEIGCTIEEALDIKQGRYIFSDDKDIRERGSVIHRQLDNARGRAEDVRARIEAEE